MNMRRISTSLLTFSLLSTSLLLDSLAAQQLRVEDVRSLYPEIFHARKGDVGYYLVVEDLPADHALAPFIEKNKYYLGYLFANSIPLAAGPEGLSERLKEAPQEFDDLVLRTVHAYLRGQGGGLLDYSSQPPRVLSLDEVARLATRFFYLQRILPDGRSAHLMCAGATGYRAEGIERVLEVEAFVYSAFFEGGEIQQNLEDAYLAAFRAVRGDETHESSAADLEALRNRAWEELERSELFRKALQTAYQRRRGSLPFVVSNG